MFCRLCVVAVCFCVWGQGWVGVGWGWVCCGIFLCQRYPVNYFSLLYYKQLMMHFYAHILIVSCLRATGVHNSWAPVWCVFVSVSAHSFMVSFFQFSGAHSLLVFFSLWLLVDTCCLVTVKYCLYTISQFKYAHT